ncbi:major facilitator superfamily domain-containing protein [Amylostereum chailletii]|nr:major facilitator superfamily domain-containing protein [Amylostereum chailletii]
MGSLVKNAVTDDIELRPLPTASTNVDKEQEIRVRVPAAEDTEAVDSSNTSGMATRTKAQRIKMHLHITALCWTMFLVGWTDGTTGPLLPRIQDVYGVNFIIVSLIFVSNCVGIIVGGLSNVYLNGRFGFGKVTVLGSVFCIVGYSIQAAAPSFPVFVVSFAISGFGIAMTLTATDTLRVWKSLRHALGSSIVSMVSRYDCSGFRCFYSFIHQTGVGAFAAPLVSTQFAQLERWSFQYLISLGLAVSVVAVLVSVFRFRTQDECRLLIGEVNTDESVSRSQGNAYTQIFRVKTVHLVALFILAYVGVEVTVGGKLITQPHVFFRLMHALGWIVTYTKEVRDGGPSSGYLSSGFFGGLALGRVALLWVSKKLGNRPAVLTYMLVAIGLELIVWFVPSLISGGVAIALIGLILGPIYPIAINETGKIPPRWLLTGSISWIAAFGTAGSAAIPFIAGVLAQEKGIWSLQPLLVSMMAVMVILWLVIPKGHSRSD